MPRSTDSSDSSPLPDPLSPLSDVAEPQRLIDQPLPILVMLFGVTGALGIPVLWMSRGFSTQGKWVLSIVVTLYTIFILWIFALIMLWCWGRISPFLS